jgi:hypothetical protein
MVANRLTELATFESPPAVTNSNGPGFQVPQAARRGVAYLVGFGLAAL